MNILSYFDQNKNWDVRLAKVILGKFMEHRYGIYVITGVFVLVQMLNKTPYINLIILSNNIFIYTIVSILVVSKLHADKIIRLSIVSFLIQLVFLLLEKQGIAVQMANGTYVSLIIAVILLLVHHKNNT